MTSKKIRDRLDEICTLFAFDYKGKSGGVDPINHKQFELFYGDTALTVNSLDKAMSTPFIDGKSLNDLYSKITISEW